MFSKKKEMKLSKFLSKILRHSPEQFGIILDKEGYVKIEKLIKQINSQPNWDGVLEDHIIQVVNNCPKQRYEIKKDLIRARYGHSTKKIDYEKREPPEILYHGTNEGVVGQILKEGIKPMDRRFVHLSDTTNFATLAGKRKGELVLLEVEAKKAFKEGIEFHYAEGEVWLCEYVPVEFIRRDKSWV